MPNNFTNKINKIKDLLLSLMDEYGDNVQFAFKAEYLGEDAEGDGLQMLNINKMESWARLRIAVDDRWRLLNEYNKFLSHAGHKNPFRVVCIDEVEGLNKNEIYRVIKSNFSDDMSKFLFTLENLKDERIEGEFSSSSFVLDNYKTLN